MFFFAKDESNYAVQYESGNGAKNKLFRKLILMLKLSRGMKKFANLLNFF